MFYIGKGRSSAGYDLNRLYNPRAGFFAITIRFDVISAMAAGSGAGALIRNKATVKSMAPFMKLPLKLADWMCTLLSMVFPNLFNAECKDMFELLSACVNSVQK